MTCGAPLRNRTVDLLLTIATPHRPGRTACTDGTPECSASTACTRCARHPVHDSFHDQQAASGPHITLGDGVQVTLSERRAVTHGRARERAGQDARRPFRTRCYGSLGAPIDGTPPTLDASPDGRSAVSRPASALAADEDTRPRPRRRAAHRELMARITALELVLPQPARGGR